MINLIISLIILQTNLVRLQEGLQPLKSDYSLNVIAKNRAKEIEKDFKHDLNWGNKTDCDIWGENLSKYNKNPVESWLNSPKHRDNILDKEYSKVGVGVNGEYIVQVFCKN